MCGVHDVTARKWQSPQMTTSAGRPCATNFIAQRLRCCLCIICRRCVPSKDPRGTPLRPPMICVVSAQCSLRECDWRALIYARPGFSAQRRERRPKYNGAHEACHSTTAGTRITVSCTCSRFTGVGIPVQTEWEPELSGSPAPPNRLKPSCPGLVFSLHPIGGVACTDSLSTRHDARPAPIWFVPNPSHLAAVCVLVLRQVSAQ